MVEQIQCVRVMHAHKKSKNFRFVIFLIVASLPKLKKCQTYLVVFLKFSKMNTNLIYKNVTDDAQKEMIIPTAAHVPPINVTVLYEYLTERMLDNGPKIK